MFPIRKPLRTLAPALAALLLALSACGSDDEGDDASSKASESSQSSESASPDSSGSQAPGLEDIPDVVAEVNGTEIAKDEFETAYTQQYQQMSMQSQTTGQKVDEDQLKKQVVDNLVNTELLVQEAEHRGISVSKAETDKTLETLAAQNGMKSGDEFVAALEKQGMDREMVESQLQHEVQIKELLAEETGDTKPSEAELRALYDQVKAQQQAAGSKGQKVPPFAKVRPQLEQQLESQQESQVASDLIGKLRKDADITVHI